LFCFRLKGTKEAFSVQERKKNVRDRKGQRCDPTSVGKVMERAALEAEVLYQKNRWRGPAKQFISKGAKKNRKKSGVLGRERAPTRYARRVEHQREVGQTGKGEDISKGETIVPLKITPSKSLDTI